MRKAVSWLALPTLIAASVCASTVASAQTVWRFACLEPTDSLEYKGYQLFADKVKEYTGGKLTVTIYPNDQLGGRNATLEQVAAGTVHIYAAAPDYLGKWVKDFNYVFSPFLFDSRDHWVRFMNGSYVQSMLKQVEQKAGVTVIGDIAGFPRGPFRVVASKKPVRTVADFKGLKLRQFQNPLVVGVWTRIGTEVRVINWAEIYESIDRGIVESVTSPVTLVEPSKFYEVAKHITRTDEYHQSVAFMTNAKAFNGLSEDAKRGVLRAFEDAAALETTLQNGSVDETLNRMKAKGATFYDKLDVNQLVKIAGEEYAARAKSGELPKGFLEAVEAAKKKS